jgi:hypothetical protein
MMLKLLKTPFGSKQLTQTKRSFSAKCYPGSVSPFTDKMDFESTTKVFPTYRVMDEKGNILKKEDDPKVNLDDEISIYFF